MTTPVVSAQSALIIDDQPEVGEYLRTVLHALGLSRVVVVGSGREALAALTRPDGNFDVILCDLQMPGSDGVEILHAFAARGVESWVIIMSVEELRIVETVGRTASERGLRVLGTVRKPIDIVQMQSLLSRISTHSESPEEPIAAAPTEALPDAFLRGELRLFYQPKVRLTTRQFVAAEALVRWQHPVFGLIPPNAFIPAIEESPNLTGLMNDYALQAAIDCSGRWRMRGYDLRVAINLSASAFERLDLPERIERLTQAANIPNEFVTLEITERQVARDATRMSEVAARLRLKRFNLSIDDFGTGLSGLAQLRNLPFSELKIDRQFVDGCADSATLRSVVEASLSLARDLRMTSVAEGVERKADWEVLARLGCDVVQGYYVARPMSEDKLRVWLGQSEEPHP